MKKCPRGMFAEIKYDGERIQIHKKGEEYSFYSRNLKKMLEWKVAAVKDYITEVFPHPSTSPLIRLRTNFSKRLTLLCSRRKPTQSSWTVRSC
jgi:hypothetical protein